MKSIVKTILFATVAFFCTSCSVSYLVSYQAYIENSPKESLQYSDSTIKVTFNPIINGVVFDIENLTQNNLFLIWDKSYFIEPTGNSTKLLNTDLFETAPEIKDKENYESILPKNGHFIRFTCSANNTTAFSKIYSTSFYNAVTHTITTNTDYSKEYLTAKYWYPGSESSYSTKRDIARFDNFEIKTVQDFIKNHDKLGLGFTIRNKDKEVEYHFRLPIKKAIISSKKSSDYVYKPIYELDKSNDFKAVKIEHPVNK